MTVMTSYKRRAPLQKLVSLCSVLFYSAQAESVGGTVQALESSTRL